MQKLINALDNLKPGPEGYHGNYRLNFSILFAIDPEQIWWEARNNAVQIDDGWTRDMQPVNGQLRGPIPLRKRSRQLRNYMLSVAPDYCTDIQEAIKTVPYGWSWSLNYMKDRRRGEYEAWVHDQRLVSSGACSYDLFGDDPCITMLRCSMRAHQAIKSGQAPNYEFRVDIPD